MKVNILDILVDKITSDQVLEKIKNWLESKEQHYLVTPNPEIVLEARKDKELKDILNKAALAIPDGIGLIFASWLYLNPLKRVQGSDLTNQILKLAKEKKYKVYFLNWQKGLSKTKEIKKSIKEKYGQIEIEGQGIEKDGENINLKIIQEFKPDILLVALGAPWQEKIINKFLFQIPSVKIAMAVGGTLDFITGKIKRAPLIFRRLGLEWFWRLICQPWRIKKIFTATCKFPLAAIKYKFKL
ncbi:MAG: N-acetylglucosaminyldiphosphoundecaprenol [Parcubacteria group bacterium Athens1014_10]|nr:MAG: N-acetylglucosaminyldiphosphoundecaprenol [Parcubacteria group bacterium Athens1014_10]TSD06034.1 MAG: N-acetylglucosaminyldiphosphoundecaprenol [Parcubacteria group bacterium Athens0714_12]